MKGPVELVPLPEAGPGKGEVPGQGGLGLDEVQKAQGLQGLRHPFVLGEPLGEVPEDAVHLLLLLEPQGLEAVVELDHGEGLYEEGCPRFRLVQEDPRHLLGHPRLHGYAVPVPP